MQELRTYTNKMIDEVATIKAQLNDLNKHSATIAGMADTLARLASSIQGSAASTEMSSPRTDASVLTNSSNSSSSANQLPTISGASQPRSPPPGVTIDTRRIKDKSEMDTATNVEKRVKEVVRATGAIKDIPVMGIQVREHHVRVLTSTEEEAALLRTHDEWVNEVFEGARVRGEDWYPVKLDDVAKAAVIKEDGRTLQDGFAEMFCMENGVTGVMKAFWLSRGNKSTGSMAVFLAKPGDAQRMIRNRLVKVGGQVAYASEFHRVARPTRCYNCNQYGHYQARCVHATTCGICSRDHRTATCTAAEKKCPACGEAHTVTDPGCPVYMREKANLARADNRLAARSQNPSSHA